MRSNYRKLGRYIQVVEFRNNELTVKTLLGVSTQKFFIPSIANTVGTDFSKYKIVKKGQFTYVADTSRRGDKIGLALLENHDIAIVSQAYTVFEIIDTTELLPEYLMMWFRRPEFDRYARYKSHGSVREIFDWEEMREVELPIPPIEKQREIVSEYQAVQKRIQLNEQLIQKLEETAQAVYRRWFVDEADENWEMTEIRELGKIITGKTPSSDCPEDFGNEMPFVTPGDFKNYNKFALGAERQLSKIGYSKLRSKILSKGSVIVTCIGSDMGKIAIAIEDCITNQQMNSIVVKKSCNTDYLYYYLNLITDEIKGIALGGSTMPMLSKSDFEKIEVVKPSHEILLRFEQSMKPINKLSINYSKENQKLTELKDLLLSKLATIEN